ncbi:MAG: tRNA 2-thiouridine(34) synthase MnmA [Desulfobulbaceae bacterium A2]|nr:MAG: tRNA 2-thiouridine(34) synthase MnmA [Desulfobulbaceae bacterium A2]
MRVGVAMSGGVDSSLAAALLLEQGHAPQGYFMELPLPRAEERWQRVRAVADQLGIPLRRVDLRQFFQTHVIKPFVAAWRQGRTPNPCVVCNAAVKFGALLEVASSDGMAALATGHYVRLARDGHGSFRVRQALDRGKDQSYFLCRLPAASLERLLFPLGALHKDDVRARAVALGLVTARESQDVCFLEGTSVPELLARHGVVAPPGRIVTGDGRELGHHQGIHCYTVGQRRGLGQPDRSPWYVLRLDGGHNQVVVGKAEELFTRRLLLRELDWRGPPPPWQGHVRLRSRQRECAARLLPRHDGGWPVECDEPQRAVTPGQYAVFYDGEQVIGSGEILCPLPEDGDGTGRGEGR